MARQIVLFGGTFDPVHHGHLIVARAVAERCGFERITFLPAATPPHKAPAGASPADRLAMLHLAIEGEAMLDVCPVELSRTGPSYTIDTLLALRQLHGPEAELRLVIGQDMLEGLPDWHRAPELLDMAALTVVARQPWRQRLQEILAGLKGKLPDRHVEALSRSVVATPMIDISSTEIRNRVREGKSIRFLLPEAVRAYIQQKGLYRSAPPAGQG